MAGGPPARPGAGRPRSRRCGGTKRPRLPQGPTGSRHLPPRPRRLPPAADLFRAALADDPDDVYALFGSGRAAGFLGQWAEAETFYKAVLVRRPGHVETLLAIAQVREQQGDAKAALADLEQAAAGDPNRLETLYRLAKLLRVTGQNERAAEYEAKYRDLQGRLIKEAAAVPPAEPIKEEPR
ncbi:tetratricopeptide repeat protein [Fimbriiglobus ruber]|uniref:Uncharacterized protein n=1 Tax=Fimbriiglobus ruber TaxID=1908690 RepID=A0A225DLF7_9BACT|nr:tetratricopeptide repeat protein [Fimbriiglobus ruber]OWK40454.1 hypothetical protein FRUB_05373 [Fimbriiglobus ruber]